MNTWQPLTDELTLILGDDDSHSQYADPLRVMSFNRAQDFFATTHTALLTSASAVPVNGLIAYPANFLAVAGVQDPLNKDWLEPQVFTPGANFCTEGFRDLGTGLYLYEDPANVPSVVVWYYARYPRVSVGSSPVLLPNWVEWGVLNLAVAYILSPDAIGVASIRRFATKRDAGVPEDNPSRRQALYHLKVYQDTIAPMTAQDREIIFRPGPR